MSTFENIFVTEMTDNQTQEEKSIQELFSAYVQEDGWLYHLNNTGTVENPLIGDWRTKLEPHPTITDLTVRVSQRFNVTWETIVTDGIASIDASGFNINRGSEGFSYGNSVTPVQTLINIAPNLDGATIGSTIGETAIISQNTPFALKANIIPETEITQPDGTELLILPYDETTKSYMHVFEIIESLTTIEQGVSIFFDATSDVTGAIVRSGNLLPDMADAIQNVSLDAFQAGDAQAAVIGKNDINWEREYPVQEGVLHFGFIQSNKPLVLKGKTILGVFIPQFNREIHRTVLQPIFNLPMWAEKEWTEGDWIIEGGESFPTKARVYVCNTTGTQLVDFATNSELWDELAARGTGIHRLLLVESASYVNQNPTGLGFSNAITVTYGITVEDDDSLVKIHSNGDIELLDTTNHYTFKFTGRVGRTGTAQKSEIYIWQEISLDGGSTWNQPADASTTILIIDSADTAKRETAEISVEEGLPVGTRFRLRIARGDTSINEGGLISLDTAGSSFSTLNNAPSAEVSIYKDIIDRL